MTLAAPGMPTAVWLRAAEAALKSAPPDILAELNVLDTDLLDAETDLSAGPGRGQPSALNVMKLITWGDLADASGRLGPAGDVLYYVDCVESAVLPSYLVSNLRYLHLVSPIFT